jgi:hypothetical protein
MASLKEIIKLCKNESGKVFIMNEEGDLSLVIMAPGQYTQLLGQQRQPTGVTPDPDKVNQAIAEARLSERQAPNFSAPIVRPQAGHDLREEVIDPSFNFDAPDDI